MGPIPIAPLRSQSDRFSILLANRSLLKVPKLVYNLCPGDPPNPGRSHSLFDSWT
ncbi:uncharacterized protein RSE6_06929 [Rhynchosporium secalis]|uniref:Uncharacterized protein n=1 Tax=Rhynchosporium secalis TaxID=38038 RepID=A0A1E1MBK5_RHYSE|nr:uncharacterized protein RSE6_06929 [Rhynchosporium secalis]